MLARRVSAEGRTRAYLGGRSATAAELRDVGAALLAFYGQHEHRKLTLASAQLEILDGFCGPVAGARAARRSPRPTPASARWPPSWRSCAPARARATASSISSSGSWGRSRRPARARPRRSELTAERLRLRHLEGLRLAAAGALEALAADEGGGRASRRWTARAGALEAMRGVDPALDALADRAAALVLEADDVAADLRRYGEAVDAPPGRFDEVEERLALFERLEAQARRLARGGAGARGGVPGAAGRSSPAPRRRWRRARRGSRRRARRSRRRRRRCGRRGPRRGRAAVGRRARGAGRAGHGRRHVRGRRVGRATATGRPAATRWSSSSRRTPASRPARCARSPRAASCRASCWP